MMTEAVTAAAERDSSRPKILCFTDFGV